MGAIKGGSGEAVEPWVWLCGSVRVTAWEVEGGGGEAVAVDVRVTGDLREGGWRLCDENGRMR